MTHDDGIMPEISEAWLLKVKLWIRENLENRQMGIVAPIEEVRRRSRSLVLRVPTTSGFVYFKANFLTKIQETELTVKLSYVRPDCMPQVLAADYKNGWMLLEDNGTSLSLFHQMDEVLYHWDQILKMLSGVQVDLYRHLSELPVQTLPNYRMESIPLQYDELLLDTSISRQNLPRGLTRHERERLEERSLYLRYICKQLSESPFPETLHHDDLQDDNIFIKQNGYTIGDWDNCYITHPFITAIGALRNVSIRWHLRRNSRHLKYLRDAYLSSWSSHTSFSYTNALHHFSIAQKVWMVCRAINWRRQASYSENALKKTHSEAAIKWLRGFLGDETILAER